MQWVHPHAQLERGGDAGGAIATAGPAGGHGFGQGNRGRVEHVVPEACQHEDGDRISVDQVPDGGGQHLVQTGGGAGDEALSNRLGTNRGAERGGHVCKLGQGQLGMRKRTEDQGLDPGGAGKLAVASNAPGVMGGGLGHAGEHVLQDGGHLGDTGHAGLSFG